jgi:hypothetical protein
MNDTEKKQLVSQALDRGAGIVRLAPTWVPRGFGIPGGRLRLHTDDLYAFGTHRGGISERWLASTAQPDNGPQTQPEEGLSNIDVDGQKVILRDAMALMGEEFLDKEAIARHGGWVMFGKLFDLMYPVPFHIHQSDEQVAALGRRGKPEAYYFPPQYNGHFGTFPHTYFGLFPETTKDQLVDRLKGWDEGKLGDNKILALSRAYCLEVGTGWFLPACTLHAPGTLCTYEPQCASDVLCMWQSVVSDFLLVDRSLIWKDIPEDHWHDYEYVVNLLDWDANVDLDFKKSRFRPPVPARSVEEMHAAGYHENWIAYGNPFFSAKELTVYPGRSVTLKDAAAYGALCVQGYGRFGKFAVSSPSLIRFGEMTEDEFFVTHRAAKEGITITNQSEFEPLVFLKHFNPGNPEVPPLKSA